MELYRILELVQTLKEERGKHVLVVDVEREVILVEEVEDGFLGKVVDEVLANVVHGAVRGGGVDVEPVGLGGSRNRHGCSILETLEEESKRERGRLRISERESKKRH